MAGSHQTMTELFNTPVIKMEKVKRLLDVPVLRDCIPVGDHILTHAGVKITTIDQQEYLVHTTFQHIEGKRGKDGGNDTIVTSAANMSDRWETVEGPISVSGRTVGDYAQTGGREYHLLFNNCQQSANRNFKKR